MRGLSMAASFDLDGAVRALIEESRKQKQDFAVHTAECNQRQQRIEEKLDTAEAARAEQARRLEDLATKTDSGIKDIYNLLWRVALMTLAGALGLLAVSVTHEARPAPDAFASSRVP